MKVMNQEVDKAIHNLMDLDESKFDTLGLPASMSTEQAKRILGSAKKVAEMLSGIDFMLVPLPLSQSLIKSMAPISRYYTDILNFPNVLASMSGEQASKNWETSVQNLSNAYSQFYSQVGPVFSASVLFDQVFQPDEMSAAATKVRIQKLESDAKDSVVRINNMESDKLATIYSKHFDSQAKSDRNLSYFWLAGIIIVVVLLMKFIWFKIEHGTIKSNELRDVIPYILTRFGIITLGSIVLGFSIRTFNSMKHNETVNLHRRNALNVFREFKDSSSDPSTKEAILIAASNTIFGARDTGFSKSEDVQVTPTPDFSKVVSATAEAIKVSRPQ